MKSVAPNIKQLDLDIVGATAFGRYPKISVEQTFNMIISDGWLVPAAGYKKVITISPNGNGRGIYSSTPFQHLILVIDNGVYIVDKSIGTAARIANIDTYSGDVFIDENDNNQIAICDKANIYIYDYRLNTFDKADIDFLPGYIAFQDGYFISPALGTSQWRLSEANNGLSWPDQPEEDGRLQTKPDHVVAALRVPGKGNYLYVFGSTVTEQWADSGLQLFPYQRSTAFNIDYGCINSATIATNGETVAWLGGNEKSGPVIMFTQGGSVQQISNDGLNYQFSQLTNPQNSYGFFYKQDGHDLYQLTFPDDGLTYVRDFTTNNFFTFTDPYMGAHIAKRVALFNNSYYFVSLIDGNLYELNSIYTTFDGEEIPRVRVTKSVKTKDSSWFVANNLSFTLEQGQSGDIQRIDLSVSNDGGESFTSYDSQELNPLGKRQNKLDFYRLGASNDMVFQFRFWGKGRFVTTDGVVNIYQ